MKRYVNFIHIDSFYFISSFNYFTIFIIIFFLSKKQKKKSLVASTGTSKATAKQVEHDILFTHLANQSKALKLKQQLWEQEKEQKKRERIYDMIRKQMELERLGVSQEQLDKYFRLTPLSKLDDAVEDDSSSSSSSSTD